MKNWKKIIFIACIAGFAFWFGFRIFALVSQHNRVVFNASRNMATNGTPVATVVVKNESDVLYEPLTIKNNRALVTGGRAGLFRAGQKVGNGEIKSVSSKIDIDTGMYVIKTAGVADGLQYAQYRRNGYFVPVYAVHDDYVFVANNGVAEKRHVVIARQDASRMLITQGLNDGDILILSTVSDGEKVQGGK